MSNGNGLFFLQNEARRKGEKVALDGKLQYQAFLFGIDRRLRLHRNERLKTSDDLEAVTSARIATIKVKAKAKASPMLDRIQGDLRPVIEKLRREGLSWKKVADYMSKYHNFDLTRGYYQKVCSDW